MTTVLGRNEYGWIARLVRVVSALSWLFLILGFVGSAIPNGFSRSTVAAALLAGTYVVGVQTVPSQWLQRPRIVEGLVVAGALLTASAVGFTGAFDSPYLLLATMPVVVASMTRGARIGFLTVALSLATVAIGQTFSAPAAPSDVLLWAGLQTLVASTFAYARRLIIEALEEANIMTLVSAETSAQVERLEHTNRLLKQLSQLADASELDATAIAEAALSNVRSAIPFRAATLSFYDGAGQAILARAGAMTSDRPSMISLHVSGRDVGRIELESDQPLTDRQRSLIDELLQPASIALANILLLQDIAKKAISEERLRVARELHDGIGPELAALGLALDIAAMQDKAGSTPDTEIRDMRSTVTRLVKEVRSTVADLRSEDDRPLSSALQDLSEELPELANRLSVDITEAGEARPFVATELNAIVTEAIRNAVEHARASQIKVTGFIARSHGNVTVADNGIGFDPEELPAGHFGVIGMRERAATIAGALSVESARGRGTEITIRWKDS